MTMRQSLFQIDAFTDMPFTGNPAGVCILNEPADEKWMQQIAMEMNLSETAFLLPEKEGWRLRWFTPAVEVEMCGHATLASAHLLWERSVLKPDETAVFYTLSGTLRARRTGRGIELDFPATPPEPAAAPEALLEALGCNCRYSGKSRFDFLLELESEEAVRNLSPDFGLLKRIPVRGVMVTSQSEDPRYDFVSRFFAPYVGIDEDPVTGSAHCCLGPYWAEKTVKTELRAYQASPRGGSLTVHVAKDRVRMVGRAVTVFKAELLIP
jgi:PhzF family phenazine biosynthesis protein